MDEPCTTLQPWETIGCWYLQGNHPFRVSSVVQDFVHRQYEVFCCSACLTSRPHALRGEFHPSWRCLGTHGMSCSSLPGFTTETRGCLEETSGLTISVNHRGVDKSGFEKSFCRLCPDTLAVTGGLTVLWLRFCCSFLFVIISSRSFLVVLWMDGILHHVETMENN